jgi:cytochrome b561
LAPSPKKDDFAHATLILLTPERGDFVSAYQSLGLTVLLLTAGRIAPWRSPTAPAPAAAGHRGLRLARIVHITIYGALFAFRLPGF